MEIVPDPMINVLRAERPAPDRGQEMMLYGQFIGSWVGKVVDHLSDGTYRELPAEVHFGWVLEGRAIQDVWIVPVRQMRQGPPGEGNRYGTTLRVYDPEKRIWLITWINPVTQAFNRMVGRQVGDDIVQEYTGEDGTLNQWLFTEISAESFHWIGRDSQDNGKTWKTSTEFFFHRQAQKEPG